MSASTVSNSGGDASKARKSWHRLVAPTALLIFGLLVLLAVIISIINTWRPHDQSVPGLSEIVELLKALAWPIALIFVVSYFDIRISAFPKRVSEGTLKAGDAEAAPEAPTKQELDDAKSRVQEAIDKVPTSEPPIREQQAPRIVEGALSELQRQALQTSEQALRETPEAKYTADDWANRAFSAYANGDFESSAGFLKKAALAEDASPQQIARFSINRGVALGQLGRLDEAIATYDMVIASFKDASEPGLREQVARALVVKCVALGQAGRSDEATATYDELIARFKDASEPGLREQVARAAVNQGVALGQTGRSDEAIATYDEVLVRFKDAGEPGLREQVARALVNKGITLGQAARSDEAMAMYDKVIARYKDSSEPGLREQVAKALFNQGVALGRAGRSDGAMAMYDKVIARSKDATEPGLRELVAKALFNKGVALGEAGLSDEAIATYDDLIARFKDASELGILKHLVMALCNKGETLGRLGKKEDALAVFDDTLKRFRKTTDSKTRDVLVEVAFARAVTLRWLDDRSEAIAALETLIDQESNSASEEVSKFVARSREYVSAPETQWQYLDGNVETSPGTQRREELPVGSHAIDSDDE
jgi:tetratricopeptide (TPR) repeat protein